MVIGAVDQDDIDITQAACGCHAPKPSSDYDDAFLRHGARETGRFFHRFVSFDESGGLLELSDETAGNRSPTTGIGVFSLFIGWTRIFLSAMADIGPCLGFMGDPATLTLMD
jgi:hypothetical protein